MTDFERLSEERIELTAFFVADHAEAVGGKLYVNGGCWDTLSVANFPARHPHLSVALALRVPHEVTDREHVIEVRLVDQDMQDVVRALRGQLHARKRAEELEPGGYRTVVMAFNLVNVTFRTAGPHSFLLTVDGEELGRARFGVTQRAKRSTQ